MSRKFTLEEVNDLELSAVEAERERIIKLLETELTRLSDIVDKGEYFDIPRIQFAMQILINLLNEIKGENK
jgi:hypothetical protein